MEDNGEVQLIEAAQKGEREAIGALIERYQREVFTFIYKMTGNIEESKDLTQEVFIKVFTKISGFNGQSTFRTWLYKIATNHTLNFLTRRPPRASDHPLDRLPDATPSSLEKIEKADLRAFVRQAVECLPERQRAIVTLRAFEEMRYAEIAEILGCSIGNCKSAYHNAMIKLREKVKHETSL